MTPDNADSQQPGLTDADNIRFEDAMEAYRVADNHYLGCLAIFEYATLYERSRKADELSKAQARIRELEELINEAVLCLPIGEPFTAWKNKVREYKTQSHD